MAYEVAEGVIRYHGLVCDKPSLCLLHNDTNPEQQSLQSLLHGCSNNITEGKPSTEPAIAMRGRSPPGQQHHYDTKPLKRRPHEGCDAERRRRHLSKGLDKVFTQSSLPREEGYLNHALRRVTMPEGVVTVGPKKLG
uniref:Uncharacterized protein n=1 Tax=Oryza rufipogon TaxID=4529 RepID=A0A0E0Q3E4_ORYRU